MSDPVKVFFLAPTDRERRWLRRFGDGPCPDGRSFCNGMFFLEEGLAADEDTPGARDQKPPKTDRRWPAKCCHCGKFFGDDTKGTYQLFRKRVYRRVDNGFECTIDEAPAGAVWDAWWVHHYNKRRGSGAPQPISPPPAPGVGSMTGPDGRCLVVRLPDGHDWMIDSRASNCSMKDNATHHCWVRRGTPEDGTLHVDKNGNTCQAGAGSILTPKWHGFLHNGHLTTA